LIIEIIGAKLQINNENGNENENFFVFLHPNRVINLKKDG
jgi:hypothetical protein